MGQIHAHCSDGTKFLVILQKQDILPVFFCFQIAAVQRQGKIQGIAAD